MSDFENPVLRAQYARLQQEAEARAARVRPAAPEDPEIFQQSVSTVVSAAREVAAALRHPTNIKLYRSISFTAFRQHARPEGYVDEGWQIVRATTASQGGWGRDASPAYTGVTLTKSGELYMHDAIKHPKGGGTIANLGLVAAGPLAERGASREANNAFLPNANSLARANLFVSRLAELAVQGTSYQPREL